MIRVWQEYLLPNNNVQIICIKNDYLKFSVYEGLSSFHLRIFHTSISW